MRPFYVYDRWGKQIDAIAHPLEAKHKDVLNGEDSLTITVPVPEDGQATLSKGYRVVWYDKFQAWHEHIVADETVSHTADGIVQTAYCENSISELLTDYIVEVEPRDATSTTALRRALEPTRWSLGTVQPTGTRSFSWYHQSAYEAVTDIVETFGGELTTSIEVAEGVVISREVNILNRRGGDYGHQFTFGRNLAGIERIVSTDCIYTALYGYGKGVQQYDETTGEATGGYSRKLTFGDVNGGQDWVGDEDAKLRYGVPDGHGGVKHAFGQVEFSDCEDQDELLQLTKDALSKASKPQVTYKGEIINLAAGGYLNGEDSQTGDTVYLRDAILDERLQGRVQETERDLLDESNVKLTLGNVTSTYTQRMAKDLADLDWLRDQSSKWDEAALLPDAYLDAVINRLNILFNTTGGFVYYEKGEGLITYDRPRDQNPTMAIQIMGAGFRIANSKNSDGSWNWRTFGTGDGFTADELVVGTIKGGSNHWNLETGDLLFEQGIISSADGENSWNLSTGELQLAHGIIHDAAGKNSWNLDNGDLSITSGTKVGTQTLQSYVDGRAASEASDAVDALERDRLTQQAIFNTLTNGGSTQGIYLQSGRVYINASYIGTGTLQAGKIQDKNGYNYWDLETGAFRLSPNTLIGSSSSSQTLSSYISSNSKDSFADATAQQVFNKLTNNGLIQGITMSGNSLYINATYINSGTLSGNRISGGIIYCTDQSSYWNLASGIFQTHSTSTIQGQSHNLYTRINRTNLEFLMDSTMIGAIKMSTDVNNASIHGLLLMSYSDLIISCPSSIGVADNYPSSTSTTQWTAAVSSASTNIFTNVRQTGNNVIDERTLELTYGTMTVKKGIITYLSTNYGTWSMQKI